MGSAVYEVARNGSSWGVRHEGEVRGEYLTKEAAFEAAIPAASRAIKQGHDVIVRVPAQDGYESPDGVPRSAETNG